MSERRQVYIRATVKASWVGMQIVVDDEDTGSWRGQVVQFGPVGPGQVRWARVVELLPGEESIPAEALRDLPPKPAPPP